MARRQLLVLLFSSLIAWQSWAAVAVPCSMPPSNSDSSADMMDHHAGHDMMAATDNTASTGSSEMQCCEDGYCSQNGCAGMTFILSTAGFGSAPQRHTVYLQPGPGLPDWSPSALFRPPSS